MGETVTRVNRSGWMVDDQGRLIAPGGAFVARVDGRDIVFYDKRNRCELPPFSLLDWLELVEEERKVPASKSAGTWGNR